MLPQQLDFFEETCTESEKLERKMQAIADSSDKVRKGIYARHAELAKKYMELHSRMEILERYICQEKPVKKPDPLLFQLD